MMKRKTGKPCLSLYINGGSDIVDQAGKPYSLDEARAAWEDGRVTDYNLAFYRLANLGFDVEALKAHYAAGKR